MWLGKEEKIGDFTWEMGTLFVYFLKKLISYLKSSILELLICGWQCMKQSVQFKQFLGEIQTLLKSIESPLIECELLRLCYISNCRNKENYFFGKFLAFETVCGRPEVFPCSKVSSHETVVRHFEFFRTTGQLPEQWGLGTSHSVANETSWPIE